MDANRQRAFRLFHAECKRQLVRLGLQGWDVKVDHRVLEGEDATDEAITTTIASARVATVTMNETYLPDDPRRLARHEVSHIFLEQLASIAESRWASEHEWDTAIESACTVLEKII